MFSLGSVDNLGRSKNVKEPVSKFIDRFRKPHVTPEKYREYKAASDKRQRFLKGVAGWFMRGGVEKGQNRNRNSIMPSQIITLDIDYATPEFTEMLLAGQILPGYRVIAHTTRSHTPEKPRFRIMIFLEGKVGRERYQAASRIVAQLVDPEMQWVDKVSFRPAQMMYMPTVSSDMEKYYVFHEQDGELLDHEEIIEQWEVMNGSADDIGNLPRVQGEDALREAQESAEDPLEKTGPVGDFCRAYSITELIAGKDDEPGILADIYEPVEWANGCIARMTYLGGTTSNGAVVYDDKFVYSHHGSDPTADMLINAYDLLRIHKFGKEDKESEKGTPLKDLPSTKKMTEFLRGDKNYRVAQAESRYDLEEMLGDDDVEYEPEDRSGASQFLEGEDEAEDDEVADTIADLVGERSSNPARKRRTNTRKNWMPRPPNKWIAKKLELTDDGIIKVTMTNLTYILLYDPRLFGKIAFNEFSKSVVMVGDFKSKMELISPIYVKDRKNGDRWQEIYDITIRAVLDAPTGPGQPGYGIKAGQEMIHNSIRLAANRNAFHPILEFLDDLRDRPTVRADAIDTMLIDYYGCPDTVYYRALSRLIMIASVARVEQPGCKFDYALILEGAQGIGKSSSISALYGEQYFGEITVNLKEMKGIAEQIGGKWALELPELSAMHKSEANDAKAFMSRQKDDVRMSYDRNISEFPRQCVIWGTTNDKKYLRDETGGRRYLVCECGNKIDVQGLLANRGILWQSAALAYDEMVEEFGDSLGDLPLYLTGEAAAEAKRLQENARKKEVHETWFEAITDWMDEEVTMQQVLGDFDRSYDEDDVLLGDGPEVKVQRVALTQKIVMREIIGSHSNVPTSAPLEIFWDKVRAMLAEAGWQFPTSTIMVGGCKARWIVRPDITKLERKNGFRMLELADAPESGSAQVDNDPDWEDLI